jgi:hypothetical protein
MKSNSLQPTVRARKVIKWRRLALLTAAVGALGQAVAGGPPRLPVHFTGLLSDYTPPAPTVSGGPYEMHGKWSLQLNEARGTATFSAEMAMETADFANSDPNHDPTKLGPHTHHISVTDGRIHDDPTDPVNWKSVCPTFKPAVSGGFVITGTAYVTGNGGNPPFGNPSPVTMCILGGTHNAGAAGPQAFVEFSNFTLMFDKGSLASAHFGTQAINGVVARCEGPWDFESGECRVAVSE